MKSGNPGLKGKLLEKGIEAYILSLEIINQLTVRYRIETFTYLICNAWELLLKSKIIDDHKTNKSIYYKKERNKERLTLSLRDCIKNIFNNANDPIRCNLERIVDLRDMAVHLIISNIPKEILGLFQSCVINYNRCLVEWFDISLSDRVSVGMMTLVFDFKPEEYDLNNPVLKKKLGRETFIYLSKFQSELQRTFDRLGKPVEFTIDIGYKLSLVKESKEGDIVLTKGESGIVTGIVQVAKDPATTHPYLRKDLTQKLNTELNLSDPNEIKGYDIECVVKTNAIKARNDFYYKGKVRGSPTQYSEPFKIWLLKEYAKDNGFFKKAREKCRKKQENSMIDG